jgi:hypothetical protein
VSWGIEFTGSKSGVSTAVTESLDKVAASYKGKEEAKDVLACKERILALVEATQLSKDGYTDWNAVIVKANGSHSTYPDGIGSANFQVSVVRTSLKL